MRTHIFTLLIFLTTLSCSSEVKNQPVISKPDTKEEMEQEKTKLKYLALGDSYTIGQSVDVTMRYPVQIADSLRKRGLPYGRSQDHCSYRLDNF